MISVYSIKPMFQKALMPILRLLKRIGVTPNQITLTAVMLSIGLGILFLYHERYPAVLLIVPAGLLIRMALNALDGMMARRFNMQTRMGEILNELGDVVSDATIIFPLAVIPGLSTIVLVVFGVLAIINEYAGLLGKALGGERRYDGPMGKSDRALLIGVFCLVYYFWKDLGDWSSWIFGTGAVLIVLSTAVRLRKALK